MKVGLIDVDGHRWPNLCLMKLSAYYKVRGDAVEWHDGRKRYDLVYMSRVFTDTYSRDYAGIVHADRIIKGGTGYGLDNRLPDAVEHTCPDDGLYPQTAGTAYGFLSRGCPRGCGFCVVGKKEGYRAVAVADLSEFWHGKKRSGCWTQTSLHVRSGSGCLGSWQTAVRRWTLRRGLTCGWSRRRTWRH